MKETRKQKIDRQRGHAADRAFDPIRTAIDDGSLTITPVTVGPPPPRYFLSTDNDSHWYLIPVERGDEWAVWCDIDSDDERAWTAPAWAEEVGGSPSLVTFADWKIS